MSAHTRQLLAILMIYSTIGSTMPMNVVQADANPRHKLVDTDRLLRKVHESDFANGVLSGLSQHRIETQLVDRAPRFSNKSTPPVLLRDQGVPQSLELANNAFELPFFPGETTASFTQGASGASAPSGGSNVTIFGPQQYNRTAGPPNQYTATFSLPAWVVSPFQLNIQNGDGLGNNRISSGTVSVNGVQVVGPSDFNQNVATISRTIVLQRQNTLNITLASKPGSYIILNIAGINTPPTANAGLNQTTFTGTTVQLSGLASSDPSGLPLTYSWSFASKPAGSMTVINGATTATPTFFADQPGTYIAQLVVNNGYSSSSPSSVTITAKNSTPVANAGPPQTVYVGSTVQLDGSGSNDPAGLPLSYSWGVISVPSGSSGVLSSSSAVKPTFIADKAGAYKFQLVVNNGYTSSAPSTVVITCQNLPPVANAGPPQTVYEQATVQLNAASSYDPAGLPITYQWSFISIPTGSNAVLSGASTPTPTFVADKSGNFIVQLVVNNGVFNSSPATVIITTLNSPPVANAGFNQSVPVHTTVQLDGSHATDVDGDPLTYSWSFVSIPAGSKAVLLNSTLVNPTFVVDVKGNYVVQLVVNDGLQNSTPATVTISTINSPPVANAGPNQSITVSGTVQLDGSASTDVDGDAITYSWSFLSLPAGSAAKLSDPNAVTPIFVADVLGTYIVQLIVNDGTVNSTAATVTITSNDVPPIANPGSAQSVNLGSIVNLDGGASADSDHQTLTFQWALLSKPANSSATLSQATSVNPYFIADLAGTYVVQLIVNDGFLSSNPVTVTISTINTPPVANAGANQTVNAGAAVQLSGAASNDVDGDSLTYIWAILNQPAGGTAVLSSSTVVNPTFVANVAGTYVVQLIVNDGTYNSQPTTVTITANPVNQPPVVNAGPNQTIALPVNTVTLNGSATDDGLPNGMLTFTWSEVSGPRGVIFSTPSKTVTDATFPGAGNYVLELTANDSQLSTSSTTTVIVNPSAVNQPPVVNAGPNQTITLPVSSVTLNGTVSDDGLPNGILNVAWNQVTGPTSVSFSSPNAAITQVGFTMPGAYVLQLSGSDGQYTNSSQVTVYVYAAGGQNQAPYVSAGPDQTIVLPAAVQLNGTAIDDGLPNASLTTQWSMVSGPGTVTFANSASPVTTAAFSMAGVYVLQLAATDSALLSISNVTITVGKLDGHGGYKGTDFWLMFPMNLDNCPNGCGTPTFQPQLIITSDVDNTGTVTIPGVNFSSNFTVSAGQAVVVQIPVAAVMGTSDLSEKKGIRVTAQSEVTVVGFSYYPASSDAYLALPTPVLGTSYMVMGYPLHGAFGSEFGIVAPYDGTTVTITPSATFQGRQAGQPYTVVLNQGGTYEGIGESAGADDLTGSKITSDKPIALFSGNRCAYLPDIPGTFDRWCNHLVEEIPPTDLWGKDFLVFPQAGQPKGGQIRMLAANDGTNVTITGNSPITLNSGQFYETLFTSPLLINADGPILVAQFETGVEYQTGNPLAGDPPINFSGDPSMFLVPAYQQFGGHYTMLTPTVGFRANYVNVVAPTSSTGQITMDGSPIQAPFTQIPDSSYSGAQVPVSIGVHHFDGTAPFGVTFYGGDDADAYSYQAGLAFDAARSGTTIHVSPPSLTQRTGTQLCATASLLDAFGNAPGGIGVGFTITGVNPSAKSVDTNSAGQAQYCYAGVNSGADTIVATIGSATDSTTITWNSNNPNRAPVVYAGSDANITLPLTANLYGAVSDDGLPLGAPLTMNWTVVSGPGIVTFGNAANAVTSASFSSAGVYDLRLTASDSQLSSFADVTVKVNAAPANQAPVVTLPASLTVNLPTVPTLSGIVSDDGLPAGAKLTLQWLQVSAPAGGSVAFSNSTSASTQATFSRAGTYVLSLTADDSQLKTTSNMTVTVLSQNEQPVISCANSGSFNAQLPTNVVTLNCSVSDDGLPQGASVTQKWMQVSGPASVVFSDPTQSAPQATFPVAGNYRLSLQASDTELTTTANVSVTVSPVNQAPTVSVTNSSQTITLPANTVTLAATITDDGQPAGSTVVQVWNQMSGPVAANIATPTQASTQVSFMTAGTYNFQIVASDSQLTANGTATVVVKPANQAPVVFAGPNQSISLPTSTLTLNGSVTDDGLPTGAKVTSAWSEVSGPASVTFSSPASPVTQATFTAAGTYVLQLSANDTLLTTTSNVTITVYPAPQNQPPVVNAGLNQIATAGLTIHLAASVTDDGLPTGSHLAILWTQLSGPSAGIIFSPTSASTNFSAAVSGTYVLQLSANDTQLTSSATVTVNVVPPANQPPIVSVGNNITITLPTNSVTLSAQVSDDGLPNGTLATLWSQLSGPAAVTFADPTKVGTLVTFPAAGTYQLRLAASDSQLTTNSNLSVTVNPADQPPTISFSPSAAVLTLPNDITTLTGTINNNPSGSAFTATWSEIAGPGPATFSNPNSLVTQITAPLVGRYNIQLTVSDGQVTSSAQGTVDVYTSAVAPPQVALNTPQDGAEITGPVNIIGTVATNTGAQAGPGQTSWEIDFSYNTQDGASTQTWIPLVRLNSFLGINQNLGTLDPTSLTNGVYTMRLTATDSWGQTSTTTSTFVVSKKAKPGDFTLSFTDLNIPVAGLPITITRTYDSTDHFVHDFGLGWSLGIANIRLQKNRVLGKNWSETFAQSSGFFGTYCLGSNQDVIVTATFPDGRQYKFQAVSTPQCSITPIANAVVGFTELPGDPGTAGATLVAADGGQALFDASIPGNVNLVDDNAQTYNPTVFVLTTRDGNKYTIDQNLGVTKMSDANGNTLTINSNGITSSTGKSITFTRNSNNQITQITDPNGNVLKYSYFGSGLSTFTDAAGNQTGFSYQTFVGLLPPYLAFITDPRGITVAANQYNSSGHLTTLTDANRVSAGFTIDEIGQKETVTDRLGNPTVYTYDSDGNITSETDPLGNISTYTFDANDNKLTATDPLGKTTNYTYDALSNRLSETDPLGNKTVYTYNARGQALTVTDPQGHTTTNVYDSNGNLTSTTDANGKTTATAYNTNGLPSSVTDANGKTTQFQYDGSGNLSQQTDALGNISAYTYDANGNKLSQVVTRTVNGTPQTLTTGYKYDPDNHLTETDYPDGTKTQVQYNSLGKQSATIDQLNRKTTYVYDNLGRLTTTTYPDNTTETVTYDAENHRLTSTDRVGHTTSYAYDSDGRLTKTTYADQSFTQTNYDADGRVSSTVDANGNTTTYGYDDAGRRTSITDALNYVTTFTYDASGNQIAVKDANQHTTQYQYDSLNRQVKVTYPDQTFSSTAYDSLGRIATKTDQAGKVTGYGYDALGRLTSVTQDDVTGGLNLVTQYGYDEVGNRISQTDANNHTTTYSYDQLGRRAGRKLPLGQAESYSYDTAGNLKTKTDFNGKTTTYAYDSSNRLLSKTPDVSFNAAPVSFTYTNNGLRATMSDPSGVTTYTYDTRNHLTQKQTPEGRLNYTYDAVGNLITLKSANANGTSDTYTYDMLNRLGTVTDASGATTYSYDAVGNLSRYTYPNGVVISYAYDSLNRLTQMGAAKGGALSSYTYTLGAAGNRTSVAELSGRIVNYGYDSLYRLTSEAVTGDPAGKNGAINYTYDAVGNRNTLNATLPPAGMMNYSYNENDQLSTDTYDSNGNTVSSTGVADIYDFENHLIQKGAVTMVYDGDGNRVAETAGGMTTTYLVDTQNPTGYAQAVDELQNGAVAKSYSYGLERISQNWQPTAGNWQPAFYGYDGHGSVRQLLDSSGTITDTYDYDAFGNLINSTGSTSNNYLFAGEQFDPVLNLYYNRARYLNTNTGRFWSMDTDQGDLNSPSSLHRYMYASDDPISKIDPSGKDSLGELGTAEAADETIDEAADSEDYEAYQALTKLTLASGYGVSQGTAIQGAIALTLTGSILLSSAAPFLGNSSEDVLLRNGHSTDGSTVLFAFGNQQGPRAPRIGIDIHVDAEGTVGPSNPPEGASAFSNVTFAPLTGYFHGIRADDVYATDGLSAIPDGSDMVPGSTNPATHWTIFPSRRMSADQFINLFLGLPWQLAGRK